MTIALIVAFDRNRVIGRDGDMPWHLPKDLRFFRRMTLGKPIIMGRITYNAIGDMLAKRHNIIVTTQADFTAPGCEVVHSVEEGLALAKGISRSLDSDEIMVIGGAQIYRATLPLADRLYLTLIDAAIEGDTFFPAIDETLWREVWSEAHPADDQHPYAFRFTRWERIAKES